MPSKSSEINIELPPLAREIWPLTQGENLIEEVQYKTEPIRTWNTDENWKSIIELNKVVLNFWDKATTPEALDILKNDGITFELFKTFFKFGISESQIEGKSTYVSIFIQNIGHPNMINFIDEQENKYDFFPKNICIEVIDENYWKIDDTIINNMKKLKNRWFNFAIADFNLEYNTNNTSFENLVTMLYNGITPDYLKIDRNYLWKIFDWQIKEEKVRELRLIIKFLKNQGVRIIWESIWNIEELNSAESLWIELFQWWIYENFELKKEEAEIRSFKKASNIKSFKLYKNDKQIIQKLSNWAPEEIMKDPKIPLSLRILSTIKQTNHEIKNVLVA